MLPQEWLLLADFTWRLDEERSWTKKTSEHQWRLCWGFAVCLFVCCRFLCVQSIEVNHVYLYVYIRVWAGYITHTHKYSYLFHHFLWFYHILFCLLNFFRGQSPWDITHKLKWCQEDCPGDPMNPAPDDITKFTWKDRRKAGIIVPKQPFHVENYETVWDTVDMYMIYMYTICIHNKS